MEKKSSKKLTIAMCAMAVALVAVVGGLIGVWAAVSQTASSKFNVQYSIGGHIAGSVAAKYQVLNGEEKAMGEKVAFSVTDDDKAAALDAAEAIALDATNKTVTAVLIGTLAVINEPKRHIKPYTLTGVVIELNKRQLDLLMSRGFEGCILIVDKSLLYVEHVVLHE